MRQKIILGLFLLLLSACNPAEAPVTPMPITQTPNPTSTPRLKPTALPTATQTPANTATPLPAFEVSCPLEDETLQSLRLILTNPLNIPSFVEDTGHHGVDYGYYQRGERESIQGIAVYAVLSGKTVLTLDDDLPYGYTVLIETALEDLPKSLQDILRQGYLPIPEDPQYRLYCPDVVPPAPSNDLSVYHLYAHMEARPTFLRGDPIASGDRLGTVGSSGWSSNAHLHLETRLGPSGATLTTMAHYENTNTIEQMANYCLWRMSGYYQLFDPAILFDAAD